MLSCRHLFIFKARKRDVAPSVCRKGLKKKFPQNLDVISRPRALNSNSWLYKVVAIYLARCVNKSLT